VGDLLWDSGTPAHRNNQVMDIDTVIEKELGDGWVRAGRYAIQRGRFFISAAMVRGQWNFLLAEGDRIVTSGSAAKCKAEAARLG
jgi:hypothetical protein